MGRRTNGEALHGIVRAPVSSRTCVSSPRALVRGISPSTNLTLTARPGTSPAKDHPRCAGRCMKPRSAPGSRPPRPRLLPAARRADRRQPRVPRARAQAAQTQLTHPQSPRRPGARARHLTGPPLVARASPRSTDEPRPAPSEIAADLPRRRPRQNERPHPICRNKRGGDRRRRRPPHRSQRARLTHWALPVGSGVEALSRPGMEDAGLG